jgi:hypothetical protein
VNDLLPENPAEVVESPARLSPAMLRAADMLGMYRAEHACRPHERAPVVTRVVILLASLGMAAVARTEPGPCAQTVHYSGPISEAHNRAFFASIEDQPATRLVMTSGGGEVAAAIALGRWVFDHGIDIEISEHCLSACANYVFTAARHKTIRPGAVVAWHGNYRHLKATALWRDGVARRVERDGQDRDTARREVLAQVDRLVRLEQDFFERIGVDQYLCWIGKMPPYSASNYYFLSKADMARFGVTHVQTPPDYERTDVSGFAFNIMHLRLGDDMP